MARQGPIRAAIYARLSLDREGSKSVDRQLADCRSLADRKGWSVVAEFRDDSRSAWKRDRRRPGWDSLLAGIEARAYEAVVVWHGDRLVRQPHDLEQLINLVEQRGLLVASMAGERDLGNADDRYILRIETAAACRESDNTARRVTSARSAAAQRGERHGFKPYGWRSPAQAKVVKRIVKDIIGGESLRSITIGLNTRKTPAPRGGEWTATQVRQVAARASNAGLRVYKGEVIGDGTWKPLISREEYEAVTATLREPSRRTNAGRARVHLLSHLAACGVCAGPMAHASSGKRQIYRCQHGLHVSIHAAETDALILAVVVERLSRPDAEDLLHPRDEDRARVLVEQLQTLRARLDAAADDYASGLIDRSQLLRVTGRLRPEVEATESELASGRRGTALDGITTGKSAGAAVTALSLARKRAVINALMEISIRPATTYAVGHHPERVEIIWRTT